MRTQLDLTGPWQFQPDPAGEGVVRGWFEPAYDVQHWRPVAAPMSFDRCMPVLDRYEGHGWYRHMFDAPDAWRDRHVSLQFAGVNYHASAWINGVHVGDHHDGFLPFALAVHHALKFGQPNTLVVRADNLARLGEAPGPQCGWRPDGGLLRAVRLVAADRLHLEHLRVTAESADGGGRLEAVIEVANEYSHDAAFALTLEVMHGDARLARHETSVLTCAAGQALHHAMSCVVPGARPWSPAEPHLYDLRVRITRSGQAVDEQVVRTGFRRIEVRDARVCLNGQPIYLVGFNRHEDSPTTGMSPDPSTTKQDLLQMKQLGANFVRLCHYPHDPAELDLCDELGLLAMGEIPLYWWDGQVQGQTHCTAKLAAAQRQLTAMIRRDSHHPSIVFWSVSNETHEQLPEVVEAHADLIKLARQLDPTRLITHASNRWQGKWADGPAGQFEHDDVIAVNAYPSVNRRRDGATYDLRESTRFWRRELERLHRKHPDKPILVSEFGYPSLQGVWDADFAEDMQARALASEFAGMDAPYVCGAAVWCWADHPWPGTGFCHHLRTSPYGVVTRDRQPLAALQLLATCFRDRLLLCPDLPYRTIRMLRPNLHELGSAQLPAGFRTVRYQPGDRANWLRIHELTYAHDPVRIDADSHERAFGADDELLSQRQLFVESPEGRRIATATAWFKDDYHGERVGQVHWVAVEPEWQGKGLAKPLLRAVLERLRDLGHDKAMLITQSTRTTAIRLYLELGFVPDPRR